LFKTVSNLGEGSVASPDNKADPCTARYLHCMKLSFQHANPHGGRESVLLRIDGLLADQTVCVLIDAGDGVAVDDLLADDEYLTAICLTHAHFDHYRSLDANLRDGAPIYTTPDTAAILEEVYESGERYYDFSDFAQIREALAPIDGDEWTTIVNGLRIRPLPAGHAPGAASFLLAIEDGDTQRTVLATGDFTHRRVAGSRGFVTDPLIDVDVLLLSAAANPAFEPEITEALGTIYERAQDGSTVLVTAGGLKGVHLAYLLGHFAAEHARSLPITLVGKAAMLAERLDDEIPGVTTTPEFADPTTVLDPGSVTIAGPDVPTIEPGTSAARLYDTIADDPGATLVQCPASGTAAIETATCTVYDFSLANHPTRATIDTVVESLAPTHVVILHETGAPADQYKDMYDSFVWVTDDVKPYTLLDETGWTPPPWVTAQTEHRVAFNGPTSHPAIAVAGDDHDYPLPSIDRHTTPDLAAEGIVLEQLTDRVALDRPAAPASSDSARENTNQAQSRSSENVPPETPTTAVPDQSTSGGTANGTTETTSSAVTTETLTSIDERLAQIEATVDQPCYSARVIDIQDGVTILRLDAAPAELQAGDVVDILADVE
jgi:putative mRNA 3-end processing factor